jgi:hypothetical protein
MSRSLAIIPFLIVLFLSLRRNLSGGRTIDQSQSKVLSQGNITTFTDTTSRTVPLVQKYALSFDVSRKIRID